MTYDWHLLAHHSEIPFYWKTAYLSVGQVYVQVDYLHQYMKKQDCIETNASLVLKYWE